MKRTMAMLVMLLGIGTLSSCKVGRFVAYNFADLNDHKKFPSRPIAKDSASFVFAVSEKQKAPKFITVKGQDNAFADYLKRQGTVAFLIIENDTIRYENYWRHYGVSSTVPSFSMAKSITSILIGCAIDDKLIASVNDPVTHYVPELKANGFDEVTLAHVLQMTSGLKFNESYTNPFGDAATFYYGTNLRRGIRKMKLKAQPGTKFEYNSGNTQLLGLVLERALKDKSISAYLEEKLWKPLGMEFNASWSLDRRKDGLEKTFCCINARARDYAKIGRLYANRGNWEGRQIVPEHWVVQSTKVDSTGGSVPYYQYQWWLPTQSGDFMAEGILGQFIYVHPKKDLIIVRLGKRKGKADWWEILAGLGRAY